MKPLPRLDFPDAIDGDGHVLEPLDVWDRYLEPGFRSRGPILTHDEQGREQLEMDGWVSKLLKAGMPGGLGAMDRVGGHVYQRESNTGFHYVDDAPLGAMDAKERVQRLDMENIARVFLYPTLTLFWLAECEDEELTQACARAYNRFIVDFCSDSDGRLIPCLLYTSPSPRDA